MAALVGDLDSWLADPVDAPRAPRRLIDLVELATNAYRQLAEQTPELLVDGIGDPAGSPDDLARWGRGRGIIDYVASLTDDRAASSATTLAGHSARLWDAGSAL
jgi:dGTPase